MTDDLIARLRKRIVAVLSGFGPPTEHDDLCQEAANAFEARDKEIADLTDEVDHYMHLAIVDPGANPQVSWKVRAKATEAKVARLRVAGGQASNVCYNLAQAQRLEDRQRDAARSAYKKWDATIATIGTKPA